MSGFGLAGRHIGDGSPCYIIGEIAQAHEGSVTLAHALIDVIADAGCDAVKMQCHIAEAESTPDEPWRVEPRWPQDANRYDYWKRMQFTRDQWIDLKAHAIERSLGFVVSPFSPEAVTLTAGSADAWKVASGEVGNGRLLDAIRATGKPVLLSSGMSALGEVFAAWNGLTPSPVATLQCTTEYPCPPEHLGLNMLNVFDGLSDHSGTIYAGLAAVTLGCDVLEVHVTLSKWAQGFDTASSLDPDKLTQLVEGIRWIERAKAHPINKDTMALKLEPMRDLFGKKHERKALERSRV